MLEELEIKMGLAPSSKYVDPRHIFGDPVGTATSSTFLDLKWFGIEMADNTTNVFFVLLSHKNKLKTNAPPRH